MQQSLSIPQVALRTKNRSERNRLSDVLEKLTLEVAKAAFHANESDLHKEWCNEIFISSPLEKDLVFRATIKPAYQR